MLLEAVILTCNSHIKQDRTIAATYHVLTGKRSIQTLQDAHLYALESFFGTAKSLDKQVFDKKVDQLARENLLRQTAPSVYQVSSQGEEWLKHHSQQLPMAYFNGLACHEAGNLFAKRLLLLVQTLTNSQNNHFSFIPVVDHQDAENWVRQFYQANRFQENKLLPQLYKELYHLLKRFSDREAGMFVDRLTGYKNYGMSRFQLAEKYSLPEADVPLYLLAITHQMLTLLEEENTKYRVLTYIRSDLQQSPMLTNSAAITQRLLHQGNTISQIAAKRRLKENTIYDHVVEIALYDANFPTEHFMDRNTHLEIIHAINQKKTQKLKQLKEAVHDEISYFQIRLVLARTNRIKK
ncbi:helix-turn-helix domain-containing protein [Lentibacillus sediminis]|uniref:helix-turn-helix domain-containing protein n=1 Tax=Lentibacillus sediminis TaxID=1940529 RepID=UPI000C1BC7F9|nr:helix-turn-helix domain-containing protein [Lentibacillus sediminis]